MKYEPTIGTSMSGSMGGVTASHNTYGSYFRKRVKPVQPRTPVQQAIRSAFTAVSQAYRTAGSRAAAAFTTAAASLTKSSKTGNKIVLTASALFQRTNVIRQRCGLPLLYDPPTTDTPPGFTIPTIILGSDGTASVTFAADEWNVSGGCVSVQISPPLTPGQTFNGRFTTYAAVANPGTTPVTETARQAYPVGATAEFQFIAQTPDGRLTNKIRVATVVVDARAMVTSVVHVGPTSATVTLGRTVTVAVNDVLVSDTTSPQDLTATTAGTYNAGSPIPVSGTNALHDIWNTASSATYIAPGQTGEIS